MIKFTFKQQFYLSVGIMICALFLEAFTGYRIFENIAWIAIGVLFIIHPVTPELFKQRYKGDTRRMDRDARLTGCVMLVIGVLIGIGA